MPMKCILFFSLRTEFVCLVGAATLLATIFGQTSLAATINTDNFYMECPTLSLMASRLGDQCYASSKDYTRFFASSLEKHGAYIQAGMPNSHFGIGCTIDNKSKLSYLGIYFTPIPNDYKIFDQLSLSSVDFSGNVGGIFEGRPIEYYAVRPIVTKTYPLPYFAHGVINCEHSDDNNGKIKNLISGYSYAPITIKNSDIFISPCYALTVCLGQRKYTIIEGKLKQNDYHILAAADLFDYFIFDNGTFIFNSNALKLCSVFYKPTDKASRYPLFSNLREACLLISKTEPKVR